MVVMGGAVLSWLLCLAGLVVAAVSGLTGRLSWPDLAIGIAYPAVVVLVLRVRAAVSWSALLLMSGVFSAANVAATAWADRTYLARLGPDDGAAWAAWLASWAWVVSVVGYCAIAFFPDGRLPSRRWWWAPTSLVTAGLLAAVSNALAPTIESYGVANPLPGPRLADSGGIGPVVGLLALAGLAGCLAAVVVRFRRGDPVARRQIGWYAYGYAVTLVVLVLAVLTDVPAVFLAVGPVAVATGAGVAILRYRLYDIDLIVNRTLVWGLLTLLVIGLYVAFVGFFQRLFAGGAAGGLLATGVVAVAFQPVRAQVQRLVNQIVYGYRDQPEVVLRELARSMDVSLPPADALFRMAGTLGRTLRLSTVVLEVVGAPQPPARYGDADAGLVEATSAQNGGSVVRVLVAPRRPGGELAARDRQILADLAPSLAATAEALRLRGALEASRLRAIAELAEAQRRMRRDLHDGLGPVLAGLRLAIGTARRLIGTAPDEAQRVLAEAQSDALAAVEDVRRLAHDLRPPALDELGLSGALRDRLERVVGEACQLHYAADLPAALPAAVEVAAYRIAVEAVLNVVRHARADRCWVSLGRHERGLVITVVDDGAGMASGVGGLGLRSVRERAEELAGTVTIDSLPGAGTSMRVWLPLSNMDDDGVSSVDGAGRSDVDGVGGAADGA
jgi:signal transduction histidine kinase